MRFSPKIIKTSYSKKQIIFFALAIVLLCLALVFIIWSFFFLGESLKSALGKPLEPPAPKGFDIQGFEKLNLIKQ